MGSWNVSNAEPDWGLNHMRDFAAVPEAIYLLDFPSATTEYGYPTDFSMEIENMMSQDDQMVVGVPFDGRQEATVEMRRRYTGFFELYSPLGSREEVIDSNGATFWQDNTNNMIWVKMRGGVWQSREGDGEDDPLYENTVLRIFEN